MKRSRSEPSNKTKERFCVLLAAGEVEEEEEVEEVVEVEVREEELEVEEVEEEVVLVTEPVVVEGGPKGIREASYIIPPRAQVSSMSPIVDCTIRFVESALNPYPRVNKSEKYEPVKQ